MKLKLTIFFLILVTHITITISAATEKPVVVFTTFSIANPSDTQYLNVSQNLIPRQIVRSKLYKTVNSTELIDINLSDNALNERLKSLSERYKSDFIVFGSIESNTSNGEIILNAKVYDSKEKEIIDIQSEITESGARFVNGCDSLSMRIFVSIAQNYQDIKIPNSESATETVSTPSL
jgi:TolB-like protein